MREGWTMLTCGMMMIFVALCIGERTQGTPPRRWLDRLYLSLAACLKIACVIWGVMYVILGGTHLLGGLSFGN